MRNLAKALIEIDDNVAQVNCASQTKEKSYEVAAEVSILSMAASGTDESAVDSSSPAYARQRDFHVCDDRRSALGAERWRAESGRDSRGHV